MLHSAILKMSCHYHCPCNQFSYHAVQVLSRHLALCQFVRLLTRGAASGSSAYGARSAQITQLSYPNLVSTSRRFCLLAEPALARLWGEGDRFFYFILSDIARVGYSLKKKIPLFSFPQSSSLYVILFCLFPAHSFLIFGAHSTH